MLGQRLSLLLALCQLTYRTSASGVKCTSSEECETVLRQGSICHEGLCTNPFHSQGCLGSYLPGKWSRKRTCGTDDPDKAEHDGYCKPSPFDYQEVRILAQNWETSFFSTWIVQIILSEILGVPTSIEVGDPAMNIDFYNLQSSLDYGTFAPDYSELTTGSVVGDCRSVTMTNDPEEYKSCAHVITEAWRAEHVTAGAFSPGGLGALGTQGLFVPRYTAEKDPSFTTFLGLRGETNRRKLAETFKRPTTWKVYCEEVSTDNCSTEDGIAKRRPKHQVEEDSYFADGLYTGHFRATYRNDCDNNPGTCTGHVIEMPCLWLSFLSQQLYHLEIALESNGDSPNGGYTYSHMGQIYRAANATKSDVMINYWFPEALGESFIGRDAEFTRVVLPPPTQECIEARVELGAGCEHDFAGRVGEPKGACDYPEKAIKKLVSDTFWQQMSGPTEAHKSPAYDVIANFEISDLQYGEIFEHWFARDTDKWNFDPRDATCRWVVDNLDSIMAIIPETYPRAIEEERITRGGLFGVAAGFAAIAIVLVLLSFLVVYATRNTKTMYYTQVQFACLVLTGMLLVALGSLILSVPPTDTSCISGIWFINIGYAVQLVPLAVRIYAINSLGRSGKQMQRVRLRTASLLKPVLGVILLVAAFLSVWTLVDPPTRDVHFELTDDTTRYDETIVKESSSCASDSDVWLFLGVSWQAFLLVPALVVAFVASRATQDVNDTKTLGLAIGAHLVFLVLRAFTISLADDRSRSEALLYTSLYLSVDTIVSLLVYVFPKFLVSADEVESEILPDLFLNTTIMLADIVGFTAWSSVREPIQVFKLLEAVFENFDVIAERYKVFKVETTGECYVAASGIPEDRSDHAVVMARFAFDCMKKMDALTKMLEVRFGPDTCDLTIRIGLHSGPVTGGFMKGNQSHFQLFGDTMTTTSLIHRTSESQKIHLSEQTAKLLIAAGRKKWLEQRTHGIQTVEKGELHTYWLCRQQSRADPEAASLVGSSVVGFSGSHGVEILDGEQRWIEWVVDVFRAHIKKIIARHAPPGSNGTSTHIDLPGPGIPLEEVQEIIERPQFDVDATRRQGSDQESVIIPEEVADQIRVLVAEIAKLYRSNPFHNFAHASYMVMAVTKYLGKIMAALDVHVGIDAEHRHSSTHEAIQDHTYGISSDPLTQFACVFAALIHDVDHPGVPNAVFVEEDPETAEVYLYRCVAEQRSFDMAWDLFMDSTFDGLRATVCPTQSEFQRLRQLVINCVVATDLFDEDLHKIRNDRWSMAFPDDSSHDADSSDAINRKATMVIEHLVQAADIAHTCQHWNIYQKWNQRLFDESYDAYENGRTQENPAEYWYDGELQFFDSFVIPLCKKLRDCGVFGMSSDENLNYAESNRALWEQKGKTIVEKMLTCREDAGRNST